MCGPEPDDLAGHRALGYEAGDPAGHLLWIGVVTDRHHIRRDAGLGPFEGRRPGTGEQPGRHHRGHRTAPTEQVVAVNDEDHADAVGHGRSGHFEHLAELVGGRLPVGTELRAGSHHDQAFASEGLERRGQAVARRDSGLHATNATRRRLAHVIHVLPDSQAVADHAATHIAETLPSVSNLVLAGGSTPAATYRALCTRDIDWERLDVWLGDERWVPHDHAESNLRMAREALAPAAHRILPTPWASDLAPEQAAAIYEDLLASRSPDGEVRPGLVLLGIGDDAHTASLFPGCDALERDDADFVTTFVHQKATWRLTLTRQALAKAEEVLFLVSGSGKADALAAIHEGDPTLPAARVTAAAPNVHWFVDEAAAAGLTHTEVVRP